MPCLYIVLMDACIDAGYHLLGIIHNDESTHIIIAANHLNLMVVPIIHYLLQLVELLELRPVNGIFLADNQLCEIEDDEMVA